ncbi:glycosyltransferase family 1 protein [Candidatus Peribacteria bacterium]|nr:glycosyltransferase family 1 protein [Candidatus Peribacteria bacterium]
MKTILLISPYWKEDHRWMVSSYKLAELWQRLGYRVIVLCMGRTPGFTKMSETLEIHRLKDFFLKDPWNYGIAFGFSRYALRLAKESNPDIIIINKVLFWSSIALLRLRLAGYNVLLTTDALVGITWWPRGRIAKICAAIYAWTLGWLILKCATKIIFFHPQSPAILKRLGIFEKSLVIPTGIDPTSYQRSAMTDGLTAHRLPLTATYIGRLESVKGADDFVAAALVVKKTHPTLTIQVVGWHPSDHPLVAAHASRVSFTGLRNDISKILSATDIFVLPSYSEGLSNALMEAMSSGCACIASDVGGNRFLIQNGVSGFLFPPGDREALAGHIRRLVEDDSKRASLGQQARKRIDEMFSWAKVSEQYRTLFHEWISSRS